MKFNVIMCFIFDFQAVNRLGSQPLKKTKSKIWEFLINKHFDRSLFLFNYDYKQSING